MTNVTPITLEQIKICKAAHNKGVGLRCLTAIAGFIATILVIYVNLAGMSVASTLVFACLAGAITYSMFTFKPNHLPNEQRCNIDYSFEELTDIEASILADKVSKGVKGVREYIKAVNTQGRDYIHHDLVMCNIIIKDEEASKEKQKQAENGRKAIDRLKAI